MRQYPRFVSESPDAGAVTDTLPADQVSQADVAHHLAVPAPLGYGSCSIEARRSVPAHLLSDVARRVYLPAKVVLLLPPSAREGASPGRTYRTCAHGVPQLTPTPPNPCTVKLRRMTPRRPHLRSQHNRATVHDAEPSTSKVIHVRVRTHKSYRIDGQFAADGVEGGRAARAKDNHHRGRLPGSKVRRGGDKSAPGH